MAKGPFFPDPPECLSQIWGAEMQEAQERRAERLRAEGKLDEADEARQIGLLYGGFRRLVR